MATSARHGNWQENDKKTANFYSWTLAGVFKNFSRKTATGCPIGRLRNLSGVKVFYKRACGIPKKGVVL